MSNNVDKRVVQMEFDNAQFERRVKTTRESLSKLKTDLKFDDNVKSLSNLKDATKGFSFDGMASGLETVNAKFSALSAVGFTVIQNLTNGVLNFGKKIASSTFGQMLSGGKTRALNLEQAQFQIQGLGVDWKSTANEFGIALYDQIDKAVSGTAYGLDAAAKVAGQLLASNVKEGSQEMQNALSGISGVAAMTNSTYEDIGDIFTTVAGNGKLMTEQLRQFSSRGLNAAATLAKSLNKSESEIRDMVSKGQIDFNTFSKAMNEAFGEQATKANETYAGSLSNVRAALSRIGAEIQTPLLDNMRQTFVALIPVLNSLKAALKPVFDVLKSGMEFFRKDIVSTLNKLAVFDKKGKTVAKGMTAFGEKVEKAFSIFKIQSFTDNLKNAYSSVKKIFSGIGKLFSAIITPIVKGLKDSAFGSKNPIVSFAETASNALSKLATFVNGFAEKVKNAVNENDALFRIAKGVGSAFSIAWTVIKGVVRVLITIGKVLAPVARLFLQVAAAIGDFIVKIKEAIDKSGRFIERFKKVKDSVSNVVSSFASIKIDGVSKFSDRFKKAMSPLDSIANFFSSLWGLVKSTVSKIGPIINSVITLVFNGISKVVSIIKDGIDNLNFNGNGSSLLASGGIIAGFVLILKKLSRINPAAIGKSITTVFDTISIRIRQLKKEKIAYTLQQFAGAILELAVAMVILSSIDPARLTTSLIAISVLMKELSSIMRTLNKETKTMNIWQRNDSSSFGGMMIQLAASVLILALAIKVLSDLDPEKALLGVVIASALLWELVAVVKVLSKGQKEMTKGASALIFMAIAIQILAKSVAFLGNLTWDELLRGLVGTIALMLALVAAVKLMSKAKGIIKAALGMVLIGSALRILVPVVKEFANIEWSALVKAELGIAGLLAILTLFSRFSKGGSLMANGAAMILMAASLKIFVSVIKSFEAINWGTIAKAGITILALVLAIGIFSRLAKGGNLIASAFGMMLVASALLVFCASIRVFAGMKWEQLTKAGIAIGGLLTMVVLFSRLCKPVALLADAVALTIFGAAMFEFALVMGAFGKMSWTTIIKGLVSMAAVFVVIGVAAKALKPMIFTILALSAAMVLFGAGLALVGVGLVAISAGLSGIIGSLMLLAKAIQYILATILGLVPMIFKIIEASIIAALGVIRNAAPALGETLKSVILTALDVIVSIAPKLGETIAVLLDTILPILVTYIPRIVDAIASILIGIINSLAERIPEIVYAVANFIKKLFGAIADVAGSSVTEDSMKGIILGLAAITACIYIISRAAKQAQKAIVGMIAIAAIMGMMTAMFFLLSLIDVNVFIGISKGLTAVILSLSVACVLLGNMPISAAAIAVANLAILIAGFIAILLALGGLKQIPGFTWLIGEGIEVLCQLGEGLGRFIGSIIKGIGLAIADMLVGIAQKLSIFAMMIQPFVQAMRKIDAKVLEGAGKIAATILALTAAEFINGVLSFLGGGLNFTKLAEDLVAFGKGMIEFSSTISGKIDTKAVSAAAEAGKAIAAMAAAMPNQGGVLGWLMGENSLGVIAPQLVPFGEGLRDFSSTISGKIDNKAVVAACEAGKAIAEMASSLPNEGGVLGWLVGENSLGTIAPQLVPFGEGLRDFSAAVKGQIDVDAVMAAVECAQAIADMSNTLPNQGGIASWFAGDNKLEDWAPQLEPLGKGLAAFSEAIGGDKIDPDAMVAAVECAKGIVELSNHIPDQDGIASWFAGDNKLEDWAPQLEPLGKGLAAFSEAVSGGNFDVDACKAAAEAGKAIAEMCDHIPRDGGIEAWFAGEQSISKFADDLPDLADGLAGFSKALTEDGAFNGNVVTAAAIAGKALAEMCNSIPKAGGIKAWFTGETKFSEWSEELPVFGEGIKDMAKSLTKVTDKDIDKIQLAAEAGEALAELCNHIPKQKGIVQWFTGETKFSEWADELPKFGSSIKKMSDSLKKVTNEDIDKISSVSEVADMLVQMSNNTPKKGGLAQWFGGENVSLSDIGEQLKYFLEYMAEGFQYFNELNKNWDKEVFELFFDEMVYILRKISDVKMEEKNLWKTERDDNLDKVGHELYYFISWMSDAYSEFNKANGKWDAKAFELFFDEMVYVLRKISDVEIASENLIKMGTDTNLDKVGHQLYYFISWMSDAYSEFNKANKGFDVKAFENFFDVSVKIIKGITSVTSNLTDESVESLNKLSSAFPGFVKNLVDLSKKISKNEVEGVKNASSAYKAIIDVVKSCPKDLSDSFASVLKELNAIDIQKWIDNSQNIETLKKGGQAFIDGFLKGAKDYRRSAITTMKNLFTGTVDGQKGILKALIDEGLKSYTVERAFKSAAENLINQMKAGFGNKEKDLKSKVSSVLSSAESTANSFKQKFIDIGINFCKGIASGIYDSEYEVLNAAYTVAQAAVDKTKKTLDVHSPSKVGERIGRFWDLGLANGILAYAHAVSNASGNVSEEVISMGKALMEEISKIEDIDDTSMTITPVLDTSEVSYGLAAISKMMNAKRSYGISADISAERSRNKASNEQTIQVKTNNDDVVAELKEVKVKMEELEGTLSDLGVYLDGDSLVGGILPRVDRGLGKRAERVRKAGR